MAQIFFGFLAKNKPVWASGKTKNIPGANWLKKCSNIKSARAFSYRTPCTIGMRDVFCTPHVCVRYLAQSIRIRVTFSMSLSIHVHVQCTYVSMYNVCPCTMYVHVRMSMYNVCPCTMYVHVQCMSVYNVRMYNVCPCTMYVHVQCMSVYNVRTCTMYVHVQCMSMYNVCPCTMYVHVQCMSMYNVCPCTMYVRVHFCQGRF